MSKKDVNNLKLIEKLKKKEDLVKELKDKVANLELERDAYKAMSEILKKSQGLSVKTISNRNKTLLINYLRPKYQKLSTLLKFFKISKSTYFDQITALGKQDKYHELRQKIKHLFKKFERRYGYRRIWKELSKNGVKVADKVVERIMQEEGLVVLRKSMKRHNSYNNDGMEPVKNWLRDKTTKDHFFHPDNPWEILTTDVTEFYLNRYKIYLSTMMDLHDSMIVSWSISLHPDRDLMVKSLEKLIEKAPKNARYILHSDQGSVYRSPFWKNMLLDNHILQSMSRKAKSGDNAPMEGFFGRMKNEFFHKRDFSGLSAKQFINRLNKYLNWYNEERIQMGLKVNNEYGFSPQEYRALKYPDMVQLNKVA